jgi:hypothetical protein
MIKNVHFIYRVVVCIAIFTHAGLFARSERDPEELSERSRTWMWDGTKKFFGGLAKDIVLVNWNLVSWDTYATLVTTFPFYAVARMTDGRLQNCFYDRKHHKNICQLDNCCRRFAQHGLIIPVFFAGATAIDARDIDLQKTSRIFIIGLPFVMLMANVIKKFDNHVLCMDGALRPWNEHFSCVRRSSGGFPSGHMATATYATALYGMRFGLPYGVPFGIYAAAVAVSFLNCNRHYLSQLVAGAGLGVAYAFAANKLIDDKLSKLQVNIEPNTQGSPAIKISYAF